MDPTQPTAPDAGTPDGVKNTEPPSGLTAEKVQEMITAGVKQGSDRAYKAADAAAKKEIKELEDQLTELTSTIEDLKSIKATAQQTAEEKAAEETAKVRKAAEKEKEVLHKRVQALEKNNADQTANRLKKELEDAIKDAAVAANAFKPHLIVTELKAVVKHDDDGKIIVVEADGSRKFDKDGTPMTAESLVAEYKQNEQNHSMFRGLGKSGSGSAGGTAPPAAPKPDSEVLRQRIDAAKEAATKRRPTEAEINAVAADVFALPGASEK